VIISPDHYLYTEDGQYVWSQERAASAWRKSMAKLDAVLTDRRVRKLVLLVGIPASGKSTWVSKNKEAGAVYFDATFTTRMSRAPLLRAAWRARVPVEAVLMETPILVALERNEARTVDRRVPDEVILTMAQKLTMEPPSVREGFVRVIRVRF
jgi:predicted kinase